MALSGDLTHNLVVIGMWDQLVNIYITKKCVTWKIVSVDKWKMSDIIRRHFTKTLQNWLTGVSRGNELLCFKW